MRCRAMERIASSSSARCLPTLRTASERANRIATASSARRILASDIRWSAQACRAACSANGCLGSLAISRVPVDASSDISFAIRRSSVNRRSSRARSRLFRASRRETSSRNAVGFIEALARGLSCASGRRSGSRQRQRGSVPVRSRGRPRPQRAAPVRLARQGEPVRRRLRRVRES